MSRTSVLSQKFGAEPRGPKRVDAAVHEPSACLLRAKHHAHRETIERSEINSGELLTQTLDLLEDPAQHDPNEPSDNRHHLGKRLPGESNAFTLHLYGGPRKGFPLIGEL